MNVRKIIYEVIKLDRGFCLKPKQIMDVKINE
jgi:hypothetical protein